MLIARIIAVCRITGRSQVAGKGEQEDPGEHGNRGGEDGHHAHQDNEVDLRDRVEPEEDPVSRCVTGGSQPGVAFIRVSVTIRPVSMRTAKVRTLPLHIPETEGVK